MVIIVCILIIISIIIQLETKHLLLKKEVQVECYPTHRQKCHLNKSKRPLKSYCKQRILLNIQINNGNPALRQNSTGGGSAVRSEVVTYQAISLDAHFYFVRRLDLH